ncbi:MAG: chemotaxis protein CheW, partial [Atribacterota bacterium]
MLATAEAKYVTFAIAGEMYAVPVEYVREIVRVPKVTRVPLTPAYVRGVANLRGEILPVMSIRQRMGFEEEDLETSKVVVLDWKGRTLGVVVDRTAQVIQITEDRIEEASTASELVRRVIRTGETLQMILEIEKLFTMGVSEAHFDARSGEARTVDKKFDEKRVEEYVQIVSFALAGEEYAFPIQDVQEIIRYARPTEVPDVPPHVKGVIHLRSTVLPIVDLRTMLALPAASTDEFTKVIVLRLRGRQFGLIVDRIHEVLRVRKSEIQKPPSLFEQAGKKGIAGIVRKEEQTIMILRSDALLSEEVAGLSQEGGERSREAKTIGREVETQYIIFRVAEERYGVDIEEVREINRIATITRVPRAPEFLEGVMNLRGEVTPIVDLRRHFGLIQGKRDESTRIIVAEIEEKKTGLIVDAVEGVEKIPQSAI